MGSYSGYVSYWDGVHYLKKRGSIDEATKINEPMKIMAVMIFRLRLVMGYLDKIYNLGKIIKQCIEHAEEVSNGFRGGGWLSC